MTEAVSNDQPIDSIGTQIRPGWRNSTSSTLDKQAAVTTRRHASLPGSVPSVYVTSTLMGDSFQQNRLNEHTDRNYDVTIPRGNNAGSSKNNAEGFMNENSIARPSTSSVNLDGKVAAGRRNSPGGIKWQNFEDEEDEETSEYYDDDEEETEDEDEENKAGVSDTETQNLLDEVEGDLESEVEDVIVNNDEISPRKNFQVTIGTSPLRKERVVGRRSRRQLISLDDETLYAMTDQLKKYYTQCFKLLMKQTVNHFDINGAVHGANKHVVEFFKKSGLDTDTLSKVWALSDVNEDGYLDHAEFSTAMHLIVLNVKGNIAVPDVLPSCIKPPVTPARNAPSQNAVNTEVFQMNAESSTDAGAHYSIHQNRRSGGDEKNQTTKTPLGWRQFDYDDPPVHSVQQQHSLSDDHLHAHFNRLEAVERLSDFSDVPPLLVDSRPTALKATQPLTCSVDTNSSTFSALTNGADLFKSTLSPQAPKGPPPKPPPRPPNRGHGRSASLDLNPLTNLSSVSFPVSTHLSLVSHTDAPSTVPVACDYSNAELFADPTPVPATSNLLQGTKTTPHTVMSYVSARSPVAAPPPPRRPILVDAEAQTEVSSRELFEEHHFKNAVQEPKLIEFNDDMEKRIKELVESDSLSTSDGRDLQVNWKERCSQLRKLNANLEYERVKLAQIRLQLEVRLQEVLPTTPSSVKPTSL